MPPLVVPILNPPNFLTGPLVGQGAWVSDTATNGSLLSGFDAFGGWATHEASTTLTKGALEPLPDLTGYVNADLQFNLLPLNNTCEAHAKISLLQGDLVTPALLIELFSNFTGTGLGGMFVGDDSGTGIDFGYPFGNGAYHTLLVAKRGADFAVVLDNVTRATYTSTTPHDVGTATAIEIQMWHNTFTGGSLMSMSSVTLTAR